MIFISYRAHALEATGIGTLLISMRPAGTWNQSHVGAPYSTPGLKSRVSVRRISRALRSDSGTSAGHADRPDGHLLLRLLIEPHRAWAAR